MNLIHLDLIEVKSRLLNLTHLNLIILDFIKVKSRSMNL